MASIVMVVLSFIVALIVSSVIIYVIAKLFGEEEGIATAVVAALVGSVIYSISYSLLGHGVLSALIAGIVWLVALRKLYDISWGKSFVIAVVVWLVTSVVGWFLPVL